MRELSADKANFGYGSAMRLGSGEAGEFILYLDPGSTQIVLEPEGGETLTVNSCRIEGV